MHRDPYGLWSPNRDGSAVRAFKATLSFRPEPWHWLDNSDDAAWWISDATQTAPDPKITQALMARRSSGPLHAAVLATAWSSELDQAWTFFKTPLNAQLVYHWLDRGLESLPLERRESDRHELRSPIHQVTTVKASWVGLQLMLTRWPNLSQYSAHGNAKSIQMTMACANMLRGWCLYEELLETTQNPFLLGEILTDAQKLGILKIQAPVPQEPVQVLIQRKPSPALTVETVAEPHSAWFLVRQLIRKFT